MELHDAIGVRTFPSNLTGSSSIPSRTSSKKVPIDYNVMNSAGFGGWPLVSWPLSRGGDHDQHDLLEESRQEDTKNNMNRSNDKDDDFDEDDDASSTVSDHALTTTTSRNLTSTDQDSMSGGPMLEEDQVATGEWTGYALLVSVPGSGIHLVNVG